MGRFWKEDEFGEFARRRFKSLLDRGRVQIHQGWKGTFSDYEHTVSQLSSIPGDTRSGQLLWRSQEAAAGVWRRGRGELRAGRGGSSTRAGGVSELPNELEPNRAAACDEPGGEHGLQEGFSPLRCQHGSTHGDVQERGSPLAHADVPGGAAVLVPVRGDGGGPVHPQRLQRLPEPGLLPEEPGPVQRLPGVTNRHMEDTHRRHRNIKFRFSLRSINLKEIRPFTWWLNRLITHKLQVWCFSESDTQKNIK